MCKAFSKWWYFMWDNKLLLFYDTFSVQNNKTLTQSKYSQNNLHVNNFTYRIPIKMPFCHKISAFCTRPAWPCLEIEGRQIDMSACIFQVNDRQSLWTVSSGSFALLKFHLTTCGCFIVPGTAANVFGCLWHFSLSCVCFSGIKWETV